MSKEQNMSNEQNNMPEWMDDSLCERCGCCDTYWEPCWKCGGEGGRNSDDLMEEDPLWYSPGDFEKCDECNGTGAFWMCLGGCDENGNH